MLVASTAALAVLAVGAGTWLAWHRYRSERAQAFERVAVTADRTAAQADRYAVDMLARLEAVAVAQPVIDADPARMRPYFDRLATTTGLPNGVGWVRADGSLGALTALPVDTPPIDLSDRTYVQEVLTTGRAAVGEAVISRMDRRPLLVFASPTFGADGSLTGLVAASVDTADPTGPLAGLVAGQDGVTLLDRADQVIADEPPPTVLVRPSHDALVARMRTTGTGIRRGTGLWGDPDRLVAWRTVPGTGWVVVVEQPATTVLAPEWRSFVQTTVVLLTAAAAVVALAASAARRVRRADATAAARTALMTGTATALSAAATVPEVDAVVRAARAHADATEVDAALGALGTQARLRAELFERVRTERERLGRLYVVSRSLAAVPSLHEVARVALDLGTQLGAAATVVAVRTQGRVDVVAQRGAPGLGVGGPEATVPPGLRPVLDGASLFCEDLQTLPPSAERDELIDRWQLGPVGAVALVPLRSRAGGLGVIGLVFGTPTPMPSDLREFLDTVGSLCGAAVDRALAYEQQRQVAELLQEGMLPDALPDVAGVALDAAYAPASDLLLVGGDWYDAIPLPDGRVLLTVGDVVGHGEDAAVTMGRMRTLVHALVDQSPPAVLDAMNRFAIGAGAMATAQVAVLDPLLGTLSVANAGHLPPLLASQDQAEFLILSPGRPLGAAADTGFVALDVDLRPDTAVVLYTDGLVERRRSDLDTDLARLRDVAAAMGREHLLHAERLTRALAGDERRDDVAVLVARLHPVGPRLRLETVAGPHTPRRIRRVMERWLTERGRGDAQRLDLLIAVTEAVTNVTRHAYADGAGPVVLEARDADGRITVTVQDRGTWRDEGSIDGRGIAIMGNLADTAVEHRGSGTTVTLVERTPVGTT